MDWRDVGLRMSERWGYRDDVLTMPGLTIYFDPTDRSQPKEGEAKSFLQKLPSSTEFTSAVAQYKDGSDARLIDYLRSDRSLGVGEREVLGELLALPAKDVRFEHKQRVRFAAMLARTFYKELCDECKRLGVNYRGEAKHMYRSCAMAAAEFVNGVNADEVLDIMGRSANRRRLDEKPFSVDLRGIVIYLNPKFPRQK